MITSLVVAVCRTLGATDCGFIISRGYRAAKTRTASARALRDEIRTTELRRVHAENDSVDGVRKMHHAMARAGWQVGADQVARLMRAAGWQGVRRGRQPITTRMGWVHWWSTARLHAALGYRTPVEVEAAYSLDQDSASVAS